jgi:hypothetical protein
LLLVGVAFFTGPGLVHLNRRGDWASSAAVSGSSVWTCFRCWVCWALVSVCSA